MMRALKLSLLVALVAACSSKADEPVNVDATPTALAVDAVDWKGKDVDVGKAVVVAESDDATFVFSDHGALTVVGGVVASEEPSRKAWQDAANVPAADGRGRWVIAADADGKVVRETIDGNVDEDVADRYGLVGLNVHRIVPLGATRIAFGYDGGFAVADGTTVTRWAAPEFARCKGGLDRVVAVTSTGVEVYDAVKKTFGAYTLAGVHDATVDGAGKLVVAADDGVYVEANGGLSHVGGLPQGNLRSIATSGDKVWMVLGTELAVRDGNGWAISSGMNVSADARLIGSASGDVWIASAGTVARYAMSGGSPELRAWEREVRPIFERSCSQCHLPGGTAGFSLATFDDWNGRKDAIKDRVVVKKDMPPAGTFLSDADRAAIGSWVDGK